LAGANSDIGTDRDTHQQPHYQQHLERADEELQHRPEHEQPHVDHEQRLAAPLVAGPPAQRRADQDAEQCGRRDQAQFPCRQAQVFLHRGGYRTDDPEDVAVQEHPADENGEQPPHEASFEGRRRLGRVDSCVLYR